MKWRRTKIPYTSKSNKPSAIKIIAQDGKYLTVPQVIEVRPADILASALRQSAPKSERLLWEKIEPMGFRRSVPLFGFVADFYHPEARICVEVDGVHRMRPAAGWRRNRVLMSKGIRTFRFHAAAVYRDPGEVAMHVLNILTLATPAKTA